MFQMHLLVQFQDIRDLNVFGCPQSIDCNTPSLEQNILRSLHNTSQSRHPRSNVQPAMQIEPALNTHQTFQHTRQNWSSCGTKNNFCQSHTFCFCLLTAILSNAQQVMAFFVFRAGFYQQQHPQDEHELRYCHLYLRAFYFLIFQ